jgi:hypothetical protein
LFFNALDETFFQLRRVPWYVALLAVQFDFYVVCALTESRPLLRQPPDEFALLHRPLISC